MTGRASGGRNGKNVIIGFILVLLLSGSWVSSAAGQDTEGTPDVDPNVVSIIGDVRNPLVLTTEELAQYPAESVEVTFDLGGVQVTHTFTGTPLIGLIEEAGLLTPRNTRYPLLQHYVVITSKDGYSIVISGGELDPMYGAVPYLLAWEVDGEPLSEADAPAYFVSPFDFFDGRMVWATTTVEVVLIGDSIPNA